MSDKTTAGYGTGLDANGWSADSEDEAPTNQITACKDDVDFLYKEKPGWNCKYIGESDPNKCLKLHNGVSVGVADCPESCNMVDKCLEAAGLGTEAGVAVTEYNKGNELNDAPMTTEYGQEPASLAGTEVGSVMQQDSLGFGQEEEEYNNNGDDEYPKEVSNEAMSSLVGTGTKSMADELENSENSFGNDNGGDESVDVVQEDSTDNYANQEEDGEDSFDSWDGNQDNGEDAWNTDGKNDNDNSNWNGVEDNGEDAWNADGDEDNKEDYESLDNWKDEDSVDGDVDNLPWDTPSAKNLNQPTGGFDSYQGGKENAFNAEPTNNLLPSGQDASPSANSEYAWELEDEESFPVGLFIALLAVFIFFIYKKSQGRNEPNTRDCSRGGYQRVQPMDHSKKW